MSADCNMWISRKWTPVKLWEKKQETMKPTGLIGRQVQYLLLNISLLIAMHSHDVHFDIHVDDKRATMGYLSKKKKKQISALLT